MNETIAKECLCRSAVFLEETPQPAATNFHSLTVKAMDWSLGMFFLWFIYRTFHSKPFFDMLCVSKRNLSKRDMIIMKMHNYSPH